MSLYTVKFILITPWLVALCISNWRTMALPNKMTGGVAVTGLLVDMCLGGWRMALEGLGSSLLCGLILLLPFLMNCAGAGCLKMMAACGLWMDIHNIIPFLVFTCCTRFLMTLVMILVDNLSKSRESHNPIRIGSTKMDMDDTDPTEVDFDDALEIDETEFVETGMILHETESTKTDLDNTSHTARDFDDTLEIDEKESTEMDLIIKRKLDKIEEIELDNTDSTEMDWDETDSLSRHRKEKTIRCNALSTITIACGDRILDKIGRLLNKNNMLTRQSSKRSISSVPFGIAIACGVWMVFILRIALGVHHT